VQVIHEILDCIEKGDLPSDELLDSLLPDELRIHADQHFSGAYAIKLASDFLTASTRNPVILDIGSGTGKFCLLAALLHREAKFIGVEYRNSFVKVAKELSSQLQLQSVSFHCENILTHSFAPYSGFFMFNPFLEHRSLKARMNDFSDDPAEEGNYEAYVYESLSNCQPGIRLVTMYIADRQIPTNFKLQDQKMGGSLRFFLSI